MDNHTPCFSPPGDDTNIWALSLSPKLCYLQVIVGRHSRRPAGCIGTAGWAVCGDSIEMGRENNNKVFYWVFKTFFFLST